MKSINSLKKITADMDVLYVEDDEDMRRDLSELFRILFNRVDTASNGLEGLSLYRSKEYNIVFTDINMPGMSGLEMIAEIRKINSDQKVVAISGDNESKLLIDIIKVGVQGFILKPIIQKEFLSAIYPICKEASLDILNHELKLELEEKKIKLENKNQELKKYFELIDGNVLTSSTDTEGIITYVSEAYCRLNGYDKEELIGKRHKILRDPSMPQNIYMKMWENLKSGEAWRGEIRNLTKEGREYWVDVNIKPIYEEKVLRGYTAIKYDISDKKAIEQLSITDSLTQLYNRRYFNEILASEVKRAKRMEIFLGFMIIDVDYFKQYNDTYGHFSGDQVLMEIADFLKDKSKRASDFVFRLGGEEFGIIFSDLDPKRSLEFANVIKDGVASLKIPHTTSRVSDYVTISSGLYIQKGREIIDDERIYKLADEALYSAKAEGRNLVQLGGV